MFGRYEEEMIRMEEKLSESRIRRCSEIQKNGYDCIKRCSTELITTIPTRSIGSEAEIEKTFRYEIPKRIQEMQIKLELVEFCGRFRGLCQHDCSDKLSSKLTSKLIYRE